MAAFRDNRAADAARSRTDVTESPLWVKPGKPQCEHMFSVLPAESGHCPTQSVCPFRACHKQTFRKLGFLARNTETLGVLMGMVPRFSNRWGSIRTVSFSLPLEDVLCRARPRSG